MVFFPQNAKPTWSTHPKAGLFLHEPLSQIEELHSFALLPSWEKKKTQRGALHFAYLICVSIYLSLNKKKHISSMRFLFEAGVLSSLNLWPSFFGVTFFLQPQKPRRGLTVLVSKSPKPRVSKVFAEKKSSGPSLDGFWGDATSKNTRKIFRPPFHP